MVRDRLIARLAELQRAIIDTAPTDFPRRFELESERDRVRAEIAALGPAPDPDSVRSTAELRAELAGLRRTVEQMRRQDVDMVQQAGGGSEAGTFHAHGDFAAINHRIAAATGRTRLEARIARLEGLLDDRGESD